MGFGGLASSLSQHPQAEGAKCEGWGLAEGGGEQGPEHVFCRKKTADHFLPDAQSRLFLLVPQAPAERRPSSHVEPGLLLWRSAAG